MQLLPGPIATHAAGPAAPAVSSSLMIFHKNLEERVEMDYI
jgi:hypothetical protein